MNKLLIGITAFLFLLPFYLGAQNDFMTPSFKQKSASTGSLFVNAGFNYTKLNLDTVNTDALGLPCIGMSIRREISPPLFFELGGQFARRGSDIGYLEYEYRNDYFDFQGIAQLKLGEGFYFNLGYQHSLMLNSFVRVYTDKFQLEYEQFETQGFTHQNMVLLGTDIQLTKSIEFRLLYTYPFADNQFSNLQFSVKVDLNNLKVGKAKRKFTSLDEALTDPLLVETLVLQRKGLKEFPMEILQCVNLEKLVLDGNELQALPPEIAHLQHLKYVSVQYNQLRTLPVELSYLNNLEELDLSYNELRELPAEIGNLSNLRFLYIGKNSLSELTQGIGNLASLIELDVAHSGVMLEIPSSVFKLRRLEKLYIDRTTMLPYNYQVAGRLQILYK